MRGYRFIVSGLVCLVLCAGCGDKTSEGVLESSSESGPPFGGVQIDYAQIQKPGEVHNAVLESFRQRWEAQAGSAFDWNRFVREVREASNETLPRFGLPAAVEESDVWLVLEKIEALRQAGIIDLIHLDTDPGGPERFVAQLVKQGTLTAKDGRTVLRRISSPKVATSSPSEAAQTGLLGMLVDVQLASAEYWSSLAASKEARFPHRSKGDLPPDQDVPDWLFQSTTDFIGGLVGTILGGGFGTLVGAYVTSIAFAAVDDAVDGLTGPPPPPVCGPCN